MKGLLFKEEMFLAATRDQNPKTQTRRVEGGLTTINENPDDWKLFYVFKPVVQSPTNKCAAFFGKPDAALPSHGCETRYRAGELVYLKEPFRVNSVNYNLGTAEVTYRYGGEVTVTCCITYETCQALKKWKSIGRWVSPMMMFEDFARYYATITDVRCERLNSISSKDCFAEGFVHPEGSVITYPDLVKKFAFLIDEDGKQIAHQQPREWYKNIIESIHGKELWIANPWVFAYEFKTIKSV